MTIDEQIAAIAAGDHAAFESLYREQYTSLIARSMAILGYDLALAEDAVDEAMLEIWRKAPSFQGPDERSALAWLRRIARNKAIDILRKTPAHERQYAPEALGDFADERPDPEQLALDGDDDKHMREWLDCLTPSHREVIILHYFCDMALSEIAAQTRVSRGTVKSRLFYARRLLKQHIAKFRAHGRDAELRGQTMRIAC